MLHKPLLLGWWPSPTCDKMGVLERSTYPSFSKGARAAASDFGPCWHVWSQHVVHVLAWTTLARLSGDLEEVLKLEAGQ